MGDTFSFTLARITVPFEIDGKHYKLRELDAGERGVWMDDVQSRTTFDATGKPRTVKAKGLQSALLALCVLDESGAMVPAAEVERWPAKVVNKIFNKAKEISGLDEEAAAAKNV